MGCQNIENMLKDAGHDYMLLLLSEIFPEKLAQFTDIDAWIQVACPRLSIDWGYAFPQPLLTPYEAAVLLKKTAYQSVFPMDYYATDSVGVWTPKHVSAEEKQAQKELAMKRRALLRQKALLSTKPVSDGRG